MRLNFLLILVTFLALGCARQVTLAERAAAAEALEKSPDMQEFFENYWRAIERHANAALETCFPLDKVPYSHATLVADLLPNGKLSKIQVDPDDPMTQCFAREFSGSPFPAPPSLAGKKGLPVRAEISLQPTRRAP